MKIKVMAHESAREILDEIKDDAMFCAMGTKCSPDCPCKKNCRPITIEIKNSKQNQKQAQNRMGAKKPPINP